MAETFTSSDIARHKITCGTAHSLQGDQRDVVVLSTVIDADFNPMSLRFLEDPNVFNVAITRAAERLVCVTSVKPDQLPSGEQRYFKKFLLHAEATPDFEALLDTFDSRFEEDIAGRLRDRGYRVISHYPSCGYKIDLVVSSGMSQWPSSATATRVIFVPMAVTRPTTSNAMSSCEGPAGQSIASPCQHGVPTPTATLRPSPIFSTTSHHDRSGLHQHSPRPT